MLKKLLSTIGFNKKPQKLVKSFQKNEVYQPKLNYSNQAKVLLSNLNRENIDFEEMEKWLTLNCFVIGDAWINQYLFYKSNKK